MKIDDCKSKLIYVRKEDGIMHEIGEAMKLSSFQMTNSTYTTGNKELNKAWSFEKNGVKFMD